MLRPVPIQPFVRDMVIDMITLDVGDDYVLRGKTGALSPPEAQLTGWFVGWVERDARRLYFATLVDGVAAETDFLKARRRVRRAASSSATDHTAPKRQQAKEAGLHRR